MAENAAVGPEVRVVAPSSLLLEKNVRRDAALDPALVSSIRENGVLQPPTVVERSDGLHVVTGQRRTLASIEAGVAQIPVLVVAERAADQLLVDQIVENDARAPLSDADRVAGFKQLSLLGVGADRIAKRTGAKRSTARAALKIAEHEEAVSALAAGQMDFDTALKLAELQESAPEQVPLAQQLIEQGQPAAHAVARAVSEHKAQVNRAAWEKWVQEQGYEPVEAPRYDDEDTAEIQHLFLDRAFKEPLAGAEGAEITGRVAWVRPFDASWEDAAGPEEVRTKFGIRGWKDKGLFSNAWGAKNPVDPVEAEKARAEKARVRNLRKQWKAATEVRRAFTAELLQRSAPPADWWRACAQLPWAPSPTPTGRQQIAAWLGISLDGVDTYRTQAVIEDWVGEHPKRLPHLLVAAGLASVECSADFDKDGYASDEFRQVTLPLLREWGYEPSTIEKEGK